MLLRRWALPRALFVLGAGLVTIALPAAGQTTGTLRAEENFRRDPNGVVLGRLAPGATVNVLGTEGNWTRVQLEGSVWLRSLEASDDPMFDLVVASDGGENLRSGPSGTILGRLEDGAFLTEVSRDAAWARVRRTGWIWSASLDGAATTAGAGVAPANTEPSSRAPGGFVNVGAGGPILTAPDGDTLAIASPARDVQVVRREGNWARVRVEGWMWMPSGSSTTAGAPDATTSPDAAALEPDDLTTGDYTGRVVQWTIQFISLERAEAVRTDFFQGEPFLLARYGGSDGAFVYVAVPVERLSEVEGLVPLERVSVTGRVRTGASALTSAPILDLIEIERSREQE